MPTYKEAWEKGGKALSDKYGGDFSKFESAARRYNATKNEGGKPGTYKTDMKDFASNSQARRDEYDRRGWQHDKTTEVKSSAPKSAPVKPANDAVGKGGNNNPSINSITSNTKGTMSNVMGQKPAMSSGNLSGGDLDTALSSKFGKISATSTSNMSLMNKKVNSPKGVTELKGTILPEIEITPKESSNKQSSPTTLGTSRDPEVDKKGREKIGGISYQSGDTYEYFGKGSMKTKGQHTRRQRDVIYNEEGKKMGTVKRNQKEGKFDVKRTRRGKKAASDRASSMRIEAGQGTAEDAKYVMKNDKSKTPSARKTRKANKLISGDNYKVGSIAKGLGSGYARGGNSSF